MHHQLGDHRVIEGRDRISGPHAGFDADRGAFAGGAWKLQMMERACRRQKTFRCVLRIDARLEGMSGKHDLVLRLRQFFTPSDAQLPFDQIDAGDHLCDGVLHLQPRVHFHEPEAVGLEPLGGVDDELDRAGA